MDFSLQTGYENEVAFIGKIIKPRYFLNTKEIHGKKLELPAIHRKNAFNSTRVSESPRLKSNHLSPTRFPSIFKKHNEMEA